MRVEKEKDYFALNKRARTEIKVGLDLIGPRGYQHKILIALASCSTIEPACAYIVKLLLNRNSPYFVEFF